MADAHKNFAYSTVASAPSPASSGTSLDVASGHGTRFPTPPFNATVWAVGEKPSPANAEVVRVTGISTDTLTIERAQESSSARTVVNGDQIAATVTAKTITDVEEGYGLFGKPPSFTHGADCDFDGSLGPYTAVGATSGTVSLLSTSSADDKYDLSSMPGCLLCQVGSGETVGFRADATVADGEGVTLATSTFTPVGTDNASIYLRLNDNDTSSVSGTYMSMMIEQDLADWQPQGNSNTNTTGIEHTPVTMNFVAQVVLLRVVRASLTYHCLYSLNGWSWNHIFSQAVGGALTNVWIGVTAPSTATWTANPVTVIPWIKVGGSGHKPW